MKIEIQDNGLLFTSNGGAEDSKFIGHLVINLALYGRIEDQNKITIRNNEVNETFEFIIENSYESLFSNQDLTHLRNINNKSINDGDYINKLKKLSYEDLKNEDSFIELQDKVLNNIKISLDDEYTDITKKQLSKIYAMNQLENVLNFSQPGSGKTLMTLMSLVSRIKGSEKIIIVSPKNAMNVWKDEVNHFMKWDKNDREVHYFNANLHPMFSDRPKKQFSDISYAKFVLINYESLHLLVKHELIMESLVSKGFHVVFDEAHRVKGKESIRNEFSMELSEKALSRHVLTGTPFSTKVNEIKKIIELAWPKGNPFISDTALNDLSTDISLSEIGLNNDNKLSLSENDKKNLDKLSKMIRPLYFSLNKQNDFGIKPAKDFYEEPHEVEPLKIQVIIDRIIKRKTMELNSILNNSKIKGSERESLLKRIRALYSAGEINIVNPYLLEEWSSFERLFRNEERVNFEELPKIKKALEITKNITSQNKKVMVWFTFVDNIINFKNLLNLNGIIAEEIHGDTTQDERDRIIKSFSKKDSKIQVLVSNPATIAESISLHKSVHDSIFVERTMSYYKWAQAKDRIHRVGSPDDVTHNYIKNKNLKIEEAIFKSLNKKHLISNKIFDEDVFASINEILKLNLLEENDMEMEGDISSEKNTEINNSKNQNKKLDVIIGKIERISLDLDF